MQVTISARDVAAPLGLPGNAWKSSGTPERIAAPEVHAIPEVASAPASGGGPALALGCQLVFARVVGPKMKTTLGSRVPGSAPIPSVSPHPPQAGKGRRGHAGSHRPRALSPIERIGICVGVAGSVSPGNYGIDEPS
jgi:hypothetical protein